MCAIKATNEYFKTKQGLTVSIYTAQRCNSKNRGYSPPAYNLSQLRDWIFSKEKFHTLYDEWVNSDYDKSKRPSVDRLDDYKEYSLDNIRVVTWKENYKKSHSDKINGINKKGLRPVSQYSIDGNFIDEFYSAAQASRETGVCRPNITKCCSGERRWAGGFVWKYTD